MTGASHRLAASILAGLILLTCPVVIFRPVYVLPVSARSTVDLAKYEVKIYVNGTPFTGLTTFYSGSTSSLTTFFGTFSAIQILGYSDFTLSHPVEGSITLSNWISYSDEQSNTLKSEKIQFYNLTGSPELNLSTMSEYGHYQVVRESDTFFEKTYTERYHVNGVLQEINNCRYNRSFQSIETITSLSGREFECNHYRTSIHSNNTLSGYTLWWWNNEHGALVRLERYNGNGTLMMIMILSTFSNDPMVSILGFLIISGIFILPFMILALSMHSRVKKFILFRSDYLKCSECGAPVEYNGKYCIYCGNELGQSIHA